MTSDQIYRWIMERRQEGSIDGSRYTVGKAWSEYVDHLLQAGLIPPNQKEVFRQEWKNVADLFKAQYFAPLWAGTKRRAF